MKIILLQRTKNGAPISLAGANTAVPVFEGSTDVTSQFTINAPAIGYPTGVTSGLGVGWNGTTKVATINSMANTLSQATLTFTASRQNASGVTTTLQAVMTVTKVNAGEDGEDATIFRLVPDTNVVNKNINVTPNTVSPTSVTVQARKIVGTTNSAVTSSDE